MSKGFEKITFSNYKSRLNDIYNGSIIIIEDFDPNDFNMSNEYKFRFIDGSIGNINANKLLQYKRVVYSANKTKNNIINHCIKHIKKVFTEKDIELNEQIINTISNALKG
jgi:hypothetical protein